MMKGRWGFSCEEDKRALGTYENEINDKNRCARRTCVPRVINNNIYMKKKKKNSFSKNQKVRATPIGKYQHIVVLLSLKVNSFH